VPEPKQRIVRLPLPIKKPIRKKKSTPKPEQQVQMALVEYICKQWPQHAKSIVKITNEGEAMHGYAKRMGLNPGASDLFLAVPNSRYHGCWIEVKPEKYNITASNEEHANRQLAFIAHMRSIGYCAKMCIGIDECIRFVGAYLRID
jgi:hypothetical protein